MNTKEKIFAWIDAEGLSDEAFAAMAGMAKSFLSKLKSGEVKKVSKEQAIRAARAMDVPVEALLVDDYPWPPPKGGVGIPPTDAEAALLVTARRICGGDPQLAEAFARLELSGPYSPRMAAGQAPPPIEPAYPEPTRRDEAKPRRSGT